MTKGLTLDELERRKQELGPAELAKLRSNCSTRPGGHTYQTLDAHCRQAVSYCIHCYCRPGIDCHPRGQGSYF